MVQVVHDLRNVLAIIIGHCELAGFTPQPKHMLSIRAAAIRGVALLEPNSTDAATADFSEPINLNLSVNEVVDIFAIELVRVGRVRLVIDLALQIPLVAGSSLWMFRSILNLCRNAHFAMIKTRGGVLNITTSAGEGLVILAVADTGIGMSEERQRSIWEPHCNGDGKHGHGLKIVKATIDSMGGKIDVTSKPGVGTTFTIFLPAIV